jgi:uncharacterized protein YqjF (DUF2071 family)
MRQQWLDLLFLHWPVSVEALRDRIPPQLEIDTFDGQAWLGIVPFNMKGVTARGCPAPSALCDFPEINVRTYVKRDGKPGVWFFSLDVPSALAVWGARTFFHLPYFQAEVHTSREDDTVHYSFRRGDLIFDASYRPIEDTSPVDDPFSHWATARYCLYCQNTRGRLFRGEIQHALWPLQRAELDIRHNTLLNGFPVGERHPSILFSRSIDVLIYPLTTKDMDQHPSFHSPANRLSQSLP